MIDSSVSLAALSEDPASHAFASVTDAQHSLAARFELCAPKLLVWELGNALFGKRQQFRAMGDSRARLLELILRDIVLDDFDRNAQTATARLAERHRLTYYDAAYLELASRSTETILVTQDEELLVAGRKELGESRALRLSEVASAKR